MEQKEKMKMTDKYKLFDLSKVLNGARFARKHDLLEPNEWHYFKKKSEEKLCVIFDEKEYWYWNDGSYMTDAPTDDDLVLLRRMKKLWIAVSKHPYSGGGYTASNAFKSKDEIVFSYSEKSYHIVEIEVEDE